jgi:hypothetical protein
MAAKSPQQGGDDAARTCSEQHDSAGACAGGGTPNFIYRSSIFNEYTWIIKSYFLVINLLHI